MATSIITKQDIQNFAPELDLSSYSDATISGMCQFATDRAADFCSVDGFDFAAVTDESDRAYISNDGELVISVRRRPIVSVTSISLIKGGFSTDLVLTQGDTQLYQVPTPGNKLVFPNSYFYLTGTYLAGGSSQLYTLRGAKVYYQASYYGGYQEIPFGLKDAVIMYFRDIYTRRNSAAAQGLASFSQGSYSETAAKGNANGDSPLVQQAQNMLLQGGYARREF